MTTSEMMQYQYKEIISQLSLIQLHDEDPRCPCTFSGGEDLNEFCLPKHFLTLAALASESASMSDDKSITKLLLDMQEEAIEYHEKAKKGIVCKRGDFPQGIAKWARETRKKIEPIYYACTPKKAHLHQEVIHLSREEAAKLSITGKCADKNTCKFTVKREGKKVQAESVDELVKAVTGLSSCRIVCNPKAELNQPEAPVKIAGKCSGNKSCTFKVSAAKTAKALIGSIPELQGAISDVQDALKKKTSLVISDKTFAIGIYTLNRYEFQNKVVSLDDIIVSHDPISFELNPKYTATLQPRMRDREAAKVQVNNIAKNLNPDVMLTDFHALDRGSPIVGEDLLVESGNGRTMAMKLTVLNHPEVWQSYQEMLRARLKEFGLSGNDLKGIKNPVLVRVRLTPVINREAFAKEANSSTSLEMSVIEKARSDAELITIESLQNMEALENETIADALRASRNKSFVVSFISRLSSQEQAGMVDAKGELSLAGVRRIVVAIFLKTFPGEVGLMLAEKFFESSEDNEVSNIFNGIGQALASLAQSEIMAREGQRYGDLTIGEDLARTVKVFARLRTEKFRVDEYLIQGQMLDRELTPFQELILKTFEENKRSGKRIGLILRNYAEGVLTSPNPAQVSFMDIGRPSKEDLFNRAVPAGQAQLSQVGLEAKQPWQMTREEFSIYKYPALTNGERLPEVIRVRKLLESNGIEIQNIEVRGSRALGVETPSSDWDIFVKVPKEQFQKADDLVTLLSKEKIDVNVNWEGVGKAGGTLRGEKTHKRLIQQALSEGKPVPPEVLKDYPELRIVKTTYDPFMGKVDFCNTTKKEREDIWSYTPLRDFLLLAAGLKAWVAICSTGLVKGVWQITFKDIPEGKVGILETVGARIKARRVHTLIKGELIFEFIIPRQEVSVEELLGGQQFIPEQRIRQEGRQAALFRQPCRAELSCGPACMVMAKPVATEQTGFPGVRAEGILPKEFEKFQVDTNLVRSEKWDSKYDVVIKNDLGVHLLLRNLPYSDRERLIAVYLDTQNKVVGIQQVTIGARDTALVPIDVILRTAILANAKGFIMSHNHPSGNPEPSREDIDVLKRLKESAQLMGLEVLDMLIVAGDKFTSLKNRGLI